MATDPVFLRLSTKLVALQGEYCPLSEAALYAIYLLVLLEKLPSVASLSASIVAYNLWGILTWLPMQQHLRSL